MVKVRSTDFEDSDNSGNSINSSYTRVIREQAEAKAFAIKDIVIILTFLAGIAAIYINVNERLVKLETKWDLVAQQLLEIKQDTTKMNNKLEESTKSLHTQVRDIEQLILISKK